MSTRHHLAAALMTALLARPVPAGAVIVFGDDEASGTQLAGLAALPEADLAERRAGLRLGGLDIDFAVRLRGMVENAVADGLGLTTRLSVNGAPPTADAAPIGPDGSVAAVLHNTADGASLAAASHLDVVMPNFVRATTDAQNMRTVARIGRDAVLDALR